MSEPARDGDRLAVLEQVALDLLTRLEAAEARLDVVSREVARGVVAREGQRDRWRDVTRTYEGAAR